MSFMIERENGRVGLTMCGSEKENVKWTLLTMTMPLKLPEDKEVLWWCCWRASERTNGRIERVARGQGHHSILRFTLCHQSTTPPQFPSHRSFTTSHFLSSATLALSVILELQHSDIAYGATSCCCLSSRHLHSRISHYRPLNPLNGIVSPLIEYDLYGFFQNIFIRKSGITCPFNSTFELYKLS